jgi:hypothetical protein
MALVVADRKLAEWIIDQGLRTASTATYHTQLELTLRCR